MKGRLRETAPNELLGVGQGGLSSSQTGDGHAVRRAGYVGQADLVTELDGIRIAAVFAADTEFDVRTSGAALGDRDFHELTHPGLINRGEGVLLHDIGLLISAEEGTGVVARHAEGGLGEVVGAEAEELGGVRDFISGQGTTGDFDHRADGVGYLHLLLLLHQGGDLVDDGRLQIELLLETDERNHNFRLGLEPLLGRLGGGLEDGAGLHARDLRELDPEAAAAEPEHRVELMQLVHAVNPKGSILTV